MKNIMERDMNHFIYEKGLRICIGRIGEGAL